MIITNLPSLDGNKTAVFGCAHILCSCGNFEIGNRLPL